MKKSNKIINCDCDRMNNVSPSFLKLVDKLLEIVVLGKWSGEISIHSYRGGVSSAYRIKHFEDTKDGGIVYKKEDLMS